MNKKGAWMIGELSEVLNPNTHFAWYRCRVPVRTDIVYRTFVAVQEDTQARSFPHSAFY